MIGRERNSFHIGAIAMRLTEPSLKRSRLRQRARLIAGEEEEEEEIISSVFAETSSIFARDTEQQFARDDP